MQMTLLTLAGAVLLCALCVFFADPILRFFGGIFSPATVRGSERLESKPELVTPPPVTPPKASSTPDVKELLHLTRMDSLPMVFKFAGRTFVWQPGSPPSYMVCYTEEDLSADREEVLRYDFGKEEES